MIYQLLAAAASGFFLFPLMVLFLSLLEAHLHTLAEIRKGDHEDQERAMLIMLSLEPSLRRRLEIMYYLRYVRSLK